MTNLVETLLNGKTVTVTFKKNDGTTTTRTVVGENDGVKMDTNDYEYISVYDVPNEHWIRINPKKVIDFSVAA